MVDILLLFVTVLSLPYSWDKIVMNYMNFEALVKIKL